MDNALLVQILGGFASLLLIVAFSHKSDERFKIILIIGNILFSIHFYFLGAYAGAAINLLNCFRVGFSMKFHKSNAVMFAFMSVYTIVGCLIYEKPLDVLPVFAAFLGTFSMYQLSGIPLRFFMCIGSSSWLVYNVISFSIGGIVTEVFIILASLTTIVRLVADKRKLENDTKI